MSYIIDASVVMQLLVTEIYTPQAKALFSSNNRLVMPEFGIVECANVLWKHVRFYGLQRVDAQKQIQILIALNIALAPVTSLMPDALVIGLKHQLTIYDSIYIALAATLGHSLITIDQKQANAAQAEGIILKSITDFS